MQQYTNEECQTSQPGLPKREQEQKRQRQFCDQRKIGHRLQENKWCINQQIAGWQAHTLQLQHVEDRFAV